MNIINDRVALLSNYDVLYLLHDIQSKNNSENFRLGPHQKNLATVTYETIKYLESTPANDQNEQQVANLVKNLRPYGLTKAEILQTLNLRPKSAVEMQLIVEESEERLTVNQIDEIIEIVQTSLSS